MRTEPLKVYKTVVSLPASLEPNTVYAVRSGAGFDLYITDLTGSIAHKSNSLRTVGDGLVYDSNTLDLQLDETIVKFDARGNLIIPSGKSITFEDDAIKEIYAGALFPIRQTSAAPRFFTNKDFTQGVFWFNLGPDDGFFDFAGTVETEDELPLGYQGEVFDAYLVSDTGDVYLWAPLSTTDMKPGDYYYDDVNSTIFLCYEYTDPFTEEPAYNLLDLTPR